MLFWSLAIGLALGCAGILAIYALRARTGEAPPAAYDLQVYRDQLKEVDRDLARGVIAPEDAERVRAEVSRRILTADTQLREAQTSGHAQSMSLRAMVVASIVLVVAGTGWVYMQMGVPGYSAVPLKARIAASDEARASRLSQAEVEARIPPAEISPDVEDEYMALITRLRGTVVERPDDLRGFELLARSEASIGNLPAAHRAKTRVIELKGDAATASDYAELADMMVSSANGYVSSDAVDALRLALEQNPTEPRARYYMGLYLMQVDRPDMAFRTWDALLRESSEEAPWVPLIQAEIEELAWRAGIQRYQMPGAATRSGPTLAEVTSARDMTPEERATMIRTMVEGLDERIREEGGTPGEWARLINALAVLGDEPGVRDALARARDVFAGDLENLAIMENAAKEAGFVE